jgi:hypothetical protein
VFDRRARLEPTLADITSPHVTISLFFDFGNANRDVAGAAQVRGTSVSRFPRSSRSSMLLANTDTDRPMNTFNFNGREKGNIFCKFDRWLLSWRMPV